VSGSAFQLPWEETESKILALTEAPALVDSSGVGDPIVERLQRESSLFEWFKFTGVSKQQLMDGLRAAIQRRDVRFPDGPIRAELEAFEYEYTGRGVRYSAPHGIHDDCVMALALAVQHHTGVSNRIDWAELLTPPSEARMAVLVQEELARRDKALREVLAERGQRYEDFMGGWEPLEVGLARIRGWWAGSHGAPGFAQTRVSTHAHRRSARPADAAAPGSWKALSIPPTRHR